MSLWRSFVSHWQIFDYVPLFHWLYFSAQNKVQLFCPIFIYHISFSTYLLSYFSLWYLPVPPGAYFFCSARMNLVNVMQFVSIASRDIFFAQYVPNFCDVNLDFFSWCGAWAGPAGSDWVGSNFFSAKISTDTEYHSFNTASQADTQCI